MRKMILDVDYYINTFSPVDTGKLLSEIIKEKHILDIH